MTVSTPPTEYTLDAGEVADLRDALKRLKQHPESPVDPDFYDQRWDSHALLSPGLRRFLEDFRRNEPAAACLVHGFPVDDPAVGPTPTHWQSRGDQASTVDTDLFMAMCGLSLGEPFSWMTLQYGRMIQDVFPIRGEEQRQSGHGSEAFLRFHNDDAFHPNTCDYLMLIGIRNPERVPTYVSSVRDLTLSPRDRQVLSEERFHILPDDEHIRQLERSVPDHPALRRAIEMRDMPPRVAILFGAHINPYVRLDGPYTTSVGGDPEAERALAALHAELERVQRAIVVEQGTLLILDNWIAVHARQAFQARYDGTDRWLRKLIVSRGLRKWSANSTEAGGRVLF